MSRIDPFTIDLLGNRDVLAVDQDPMGKAASRIWREGQLEVWSRPLWDGTVAVGLVNTGPEAATGTVNWADLGIQGSQPVRDLWLHKNVGTLDGKYAVSVPAHGTVLLKSLTY